MIHAPEIRNVPLFMKPWWLDAVAPNQWRSLPYSENGREIARLTFRERTKLGLTMIDQPPMTKMLGPWWEKNQFKHSKKHEWEKKVLQTLFAQISHFDYININFHYNITNWLPLYWLGYEQTTFYSYVINDIKNLDQVWSGFSSTTRNLIRKAEKILTVEESDDAEVFYGLLEMVFQRKGMSTTIERSCFHRLNEACKAHNCRRILFARDGEGRIHSAVFIVWDENSAYYLMSGSDPQFRSSNSNALLIWEAIKLASQFVNTFDFEGSMLESVEQFIRDFGGTQMPYFNIRRANRKAELFLQANRLRRVVLNVHHGMRT